MSMLNMSWCTEQFDTFYKNLYVNQTFDLSEMAYGKIGIEDVQWFCNNTDVATVDNKGVVTAKDNGKAIIQATPKNGSSLPHFSFAVTVRTGLRKLELSAPKQNLFVGEKVQLSWTANGPKIMSNTHEYVTFKSSKPEILSVTNDGVITARKEGRAFIKIQSKDLSSSDLLEFSVRNMVKRIFVDEVPETIAVGETVKAKAYIYPEDAIIQTLKWSSSSNIKVSSTGEITGLSEGVAYVKATSDDGHKTDTKKLEVYSLVRDVQLSDEELALKLGEKKKITAKVTPKLRSRPPFWTEVEWKSNKPKVVDVSSDGTVIGKAPGYAMITATTKDGGKTDTCMVKVVGSRLDKTIGLFDASAKKNDMYTNDTIELPFTILKIGSTEEPEIKIYGGHHSFKVENNIIYFTPKEVGDYAIILGEDKDIDKATVHATSRIKSIDISTDKLQASSAGRYRFYNGQTGFLYADIQPISTDNLKYLKWKSSDTNIFSISDNGSFHANNIGTCTVTLQTSDLSHSTNIYVEVVPLAERISTSQSVKMGTFVDYEPEVTFYIPQDLKDKFDYVQNDKYKLELVKLYLPRTYLEQEISYEKQRRREWHSYKKNDYDGKKKLNDLMNKSMERKSTFNSWLVNSKDDFCLVDNNKPILNRNYVKIDPITISGKKLFGTMPCEAEIRLTSEDGNHEAFFFVQVDGSIKDEILIRKDGKWVHFYEKSKEKPPKKYTSKDNIKTGENKRAVTLEDRAKRYNIELPLEMSNIKFDLTRKDLVDIAIRFISYFDKKIVPNTSSNIFVDYDKKAPNQAFQLGLISLNADRRFHPNEKISRQELADMLYKCLKLVNKQPRRQNNRIKVYNDLEVVDEVYKDGVILLSIQNEFIKSDSPNMLRPTEIISLEEAILSTMDLLDNISYPQDEKQ